MPLKYLSNRETSRHAFMQKWRHRYHRKVTPSVCLDLDVGDVKRAKL